jgi:hypothetical protein
MTLEIGLTLGIIVMALVLFATEKYGNRLGLDGVDRVPDHG